MAPIQTTTDKKTIEICGQTVDAIVTTNLYYDDLTLDDVIGDAEDRAELEAKINRGDLLIGLITVTARAFGLEGSGSLGGCYIEGPDDLEAYTDDYGLVDEAIKELKANIISTANELAPFQGGAV